MSAISKRIQSIQSIQSILSFLLACAIGLCFCVCVRADTVIAEPTPPALSAQSAVLINAENGTVYFEKDADRRMGPASTTKLMTALVVAESCDPDTVVTVSPNAVGIEGSSIYLIEGEKLTVKELLYALLLSSANDAATALAIATSGSVDAFCARMNERAEQMGLKDTYFQNPHGLYHEEHYTTARELAAIAAEVLRIPLLREIVSTDRYTISHDTVPDRRLLVNHNKLLRSYDGAIGMKTGFTKKTGRTLVSAAEREGLILIAVTLNAPDDWRDHTAMLDYGFASYETVTWAPEGVFSFDMQVSDGSQSTVTLTNTNALTLTLKKGHEEPRVLVTSTTHFLVGSVKQGASVATVTIVCEGQATSSPLVATHSVQAKTKARQNPIERVLNFFKID